MGRRTHPEDMKIKLKELIDFKMLALFGGTTPNRGPKSKIWLLEALGNGSMNRGSKFRNGLVEAFSNN